jgi:hypothetical protein
MAEIAAERLGRHGAVTPSTVVVGSTETTPYAGSGQSDPVGQEPPLGVVDAAPIVGEPHEIAASIVAQVVPPPEFLASPLAQAATGGSAAPSPSSLVESAEPPSFSKNKG